MPTRDAERVRPALAPWVGLVATVVLVVVAVGWPMLTGLGTAHRRDEHTQLPPLHGFWSPGWGRGTAPAVAIAVVTWLVAAEWARRLPWRRLQLGAYALGLGRL